MPSRSEVLGDAIEAWRALPDVQRGMVQLACIARGEDEPAFDVAVALLRAAAEPEAKAMCLYCGGVGLLHHGKHGSEVCPYCKPGAVRR